MSEKETESETEQEEEIEGENAQESENIDSSEKIYTYKVFKSNNGKCIAKGLERRGN